MADDIMIKHVPLLCLQIAYDILVSRLFYFVLKPLRVPLIIAQVSADFTLSPSLLGNFEWVFSLFYSQYGILAVETFANLGIIYYVFLSGLEMNSDTILRSRKKGFPVLARILANLKLLYTKLGKDALITTMLTDAYSWVMFTLLIPYSTRGGKPYLSVISTLMFIVFCFVVVRLILTPIIEHITSMNTWRKSHLLDVLTGVFICSYITNSLGTHPIVGAFVFGLIFPHGKFADMVLEFSANFFFGILRPIYFAGFGFRLNFAFLLKQKNAGLMLLIMLLLGIPKVLSYVIVTFFFDVPSRDGVAIGLLLNTKGIMVGILPNVAWDKRILDPYTFMVMMLAIIVMTIMVFPLINAIYKPKFRFMQSQLRTMQKLRFDVELRIVACVHNVKHANNMIHVIEATNATRLSSIHVLKV
ncbi:hypothetical protein KIW84_063461 [Lathyrus oleraceus]|uniref:Cation/H+ exchanger transmembrane domain-containing protein n=1 Tax=Pisum sativum TaxID=3888 RepID=A0A9D4WBM9_PEA|nr:hypothetical protein KIW84_063461 [Pisum sativum]